MINRNASAALLPATRIALFVLLATGAGIAAAKHEQAQFERVATFIVCANSSCDRDLVEETSAEIAAASEDGRTLIYTDSLLGAIGLVDISQPSQPQGKGIVKLAGEPTSVAVTGRHALVGVNTSESFVNPSGYLAVFDLPACLADVGACAPIRKIDLGGQPDSIAVSPDRRYAAIAIENERDEEVTVDGVEGGLPQLPAGFLIIVDLAGAPASWTVRNVPLTGLAGYAQEDPEPEYVSINALNIAAVTLQENNHIVLVHLPTGLILKELSAGSVDLKDIDIVEDRLIDPTGSLSDVAREPDAIAWLNGRVVTANEGDLFGGSRGFTVFGVNGRVRFDSGNDLEHLAIAHGHYPEDRSENKGTEPEGVAVARYGASNYLFVGSERGNFVAAYRAAGPHLKFLQLLPTGIGPEGLLPVPERNLLIVSSEDDADIRSQITIFKLRDQPASYPTIVAEDAKIDGRKLPIGWVALSALAADRHDADTLYTVHDNFLAHSRIYKVDVSDKPARIVDVQPLTKDEQPVGYDIEGLVQRRGGGFWAVSEGAGSVDDLEQPVTSANLLIEIARDGRVLQEIGLPAAVDAQQRRFGFEGVAVVDDGFDEKVYVVFQREWVGDPSGLVRIGEYDTGTGEWRFFHYPLDAVESPAGGSVGLSEIVAVGDERFAVIERDNIGGPDARIKRVYKFSIAGVTPAPPGSAFPVLGKSLVLDILPVLQATGGWTQEKLEGLTLAKDGKVYAVTDNDGLDGNTGETQFLRLGRWRR